MVKIIGICSVLLVFLIGVSSAYAQLPPEVSQSEQVCEQLEISNRLYNPVTITMGYDKATLRTPEVIVSKSNPDAVVPIQILETNSNIFTNATGRFVAKVDLVYAAPSEQPRLVTYNILSGRGGMELERGTWLVDGSGFCKVITFTVTEEPHIPTVEEQLALAKEVTAVELKKNREEQMKTNDLSAIQNIMFVALICAILISKVISVLVNHSDRLSTKELNKKLIDGRRQLLEARDEFKRSVEHNDLMNESARKGMSDQQVWMEKSFTGIVSKLQSHVDDTMKNFAFAIDQCLRNSKPVMETKPIELPVIPPITPPTTKTEVVPEQSEFPPFVAQGIGLFDRAIEKLPTNVIEKIKSITRQKEQPKTFEQWFEFYNAEPDREKLLKIYNELHSQLSKDLENRDLKEQYNALYKVLRIRE